MEQHYLLFKDSSQGMKTYDYLKSQGAKITISPTPRAASLCCGLAILLKKEESLDHIKELLKGQEDMVERYFTMKADVNPKRDRFL